SPLSGSHRRNDARCAPLAPLSDRANRTFSSLPRRANSSRGLGPRARLPHRSGSDRGRVMIVGRWRATRGLPLFGRLRLHGGTIPTALLVLAMATAAGALRAQDLDPQRIVDPLERLARQAAWLSDASDGFDAEEADAEDEGEEGIAEPEPVSTT